MNGKTITQFIIEQQRQVSGASGAFTGLVNDVVLACKIISNTVSKGALVGVLGSAGSENVQGETQKKLDVISNDIMIQSNEWAGRAQHAYQRAFADGIGDDLAGQHHIIDQPGKSTTGAGHLTLLFDDELSNGLAIHVISSKL